MLLQVLFGEVLEVSLAEGDGSLNDDLVAVLGDGDGGAQVAGLVVDLDVLLEVGLEVVEHDNVIFYWKLAVYDKLQCDLLLLLLALLIQDLLAHSYLFNI